MGALPPHFFVWLLYMHMSGQATPIAGFKTEAMCVPSLASQRGRAACSRPLPGEVGGFAPPRVQGNGATKPRNSVVFSRSSLASARGGWRSQVGCFTVSGRKTAI